MAILETGMIRRLRKTKKVIRGEEESLKGLNCIGDVPDSVDLLFVFDDWIKADGTLWDVLKKDYVPKLNAQGTQVIRTIPWRFLACVKNGGYAFEHKDEYTDDEAGYKKIAEDIVREYVYKHDLDGLDVDIEHTSSPLVQEPGNQKAYERSIKVFAEIGKLIGPKGKDKSKLLIIDSTYTADKNPMMTAGHAQYVDYVLAQTYGKAGVDGTYENATKEWVGTREKRWQSYRKYIDSRQYLIGFSFYEERAPKDNRWYDVPMANQKLEDTRAADYAKWQPETGGIKGGVFSYALDHDGVIHPTEDDANRFVENQPATWHQSYYAAVTEYKDTIALKMMMEEADANQHITKEDFPDDELRADIIAKIGDFRGNIYNYDGMLEISNPKIKDLAGLEKMKQLKGLKLSEMTGLENISLSGLRLEILDFEGVENWKQIKKINISDNRLDLSSESPDAKTFKTLYDTALQNGANPRTDIIFESQRPTPYPNPIFSDNPVKFRS